MSLTLEDAERLRDALNDLLRGRQLQSFAKLTPLSTNDGFYSVRIVLHPDEDRIRGDFPGVQFSPWGGSASGKQYVKRTPRTPSQREAPYDDWYPGITKRRHEPSLDYPDVNPFYPGLRRVPEIQDLVRRVAMKPELEERLSKVARIMRLTSRLEKFAARAGHGYTKESEYLVESLISFLKAEGHTGRHKVVRVINDIKKAMKSDGYSFSKE